MHPDGFSLFVYNENEEIISSVQQTHENLAGHAGIEELFSALQASQPACQSVTLIVESEYYTLIPEALFKPEKNEDFLRLHHPALPGSHQIFHTHYKHRGYVLIYAFDKHIIKSLRAVYPLMTVQHHLHQLLEEEHQGKEERIAVWVRSKQIDCLACQNNSILLLNNYQYQTGEDIVYHVLNMLHHLPLNHETAGVEIYRDDNTAFFSEKLLKDYFPHVKCKNIPSGL